MMMQNRTWDAASSFAWKNFSGGGPNIHQFGLDRCPRIGRAAPVDLLPEMRVNGWQTALNQRQSLECVNVEICKWQQPIVRY